MKIYSKKLVEVIIAAFAFMAFTYLVSRGHLAYMDTMASDALLKYANLSSDKIFSAIRSIGHFSICFFLASAMALYSYFRHGIRSACAITLIFILLVNTGHWLKDVTARPRPPEIYYRKAVWYRYLPVPEKLIEKEKAVTKQGYSYPSGHSLRTFFLFAVAAMLIGAEAIPRCLKETARGFFYVLIILIGTSSVYLGAHWLSDIIGAYILAYIFYVVLLLCAGKELYNFRRSGL